jgi:hypothetical protein
MLTPPNLDRIIGRIAAKQLAMAGFLSGKLRFRGDPDQIAFSHTPIDHQLLI